MLPMMTGFEVLAEVGITTEPAGVGEASSARFVDGAAAGHLRTHMAGMSHPCLLGSLSVSVAVPSAMEPPERMLSWTAAGGGVDLGTPTAPVWAGPPRWQVQPSRGSLDGTYRSTRRTTSEDRG